MGHIIHMIHMITVYELRSAVQPKLPNGTVPNTVEWRSTACPCPCPVHVGSGPKD